MKRMSGISANALSRREFLKVLGITGGAIALGACGAQSSPQSTPNPTIPPTPAAPKVDGALKYIGWEGYDAADAQAFPTSAAWLKENGVSISSTYIGNNEEMFTKLKASGPGSYDLCTPYVGVLGAWLDSDLLEPIDTSRLTNFADVFPEFQSMPVIVRDNKQYAIPFTWAPSAQLYNADKIPTPPESWMDLLDEKYKGRIVTIDGHDGFLTTMALILGFKDPDPHHITKEQLQECKDLGMKFLAQIKTIAPSYGEVKNILVAGDADITMGEWAAVAGWAQAEGVNIQTNLPKEGSLTYIDGYAIPKGAPNMDTALAWIDHILSPQVQADMATFVTQGVVNTKAVDMLPPAGKDFLDYKNLNKVLERAPAYPPVPDSSDQYATYSDWLQTWEEMKAGM